MLLVPFTCFRDRYMKKIIKEKLSWGIFLIAGLFANAQAMKSSAIRMPFPNPEAVQYAKITGYFGSTRGFHPSTFYLGDQVYYEPNSTIGWSFGIQMLVKQKNLQYHVSGCRAN